MNIVAGKFYKTRDGEKAYVVAVRTDTTAYDTVVGWVIGGGVMSWASGGSWNAPHPHDNDIVAEWPQEIVAWAVIGPAGNYDVFKHEDNARSWVYGGRGRVIKLVGIDDGTT